MQPLFKAKDFFMKKVDVDQIAGGKKRCLMPTHSLFKYLKRFAAPPFLVRQSAGWLYHEGGVGQL